MNKDLPEAVEEPRPKSESCPCCIADRKRRKQEARQESLVNPRRK